MESIYLNTTCTFLRAFVLEVKLDIIFEHCFLETLVFSP